MHSLTHRPKQSLQHVDVVSTVSPAAASCSLVVAVAVAAMAMVVAVVVPTGRTSQPRRAAAIQEKTLPMMAVLRLLLRDECYDWVAMMTVSSGGDGGGAAKASDTRRPQSGACDSQQPGGEAHHHQAH